MTLIAQRVSASIVSAFVDERGGGNAAGVVLCETEFSEAQMQAIAADIALSETAFVRKREGGFAVDFFTPTTRIPDCGHATIAAFGLLAQRGLLSGNTTKFTINGPRAIHFEGDTVFMQQPPPRYSFIADYAAILAAIGADESSLVTLPTIARHDVGFIIVALTNAASLAGLQPNMPGITSVTNAHGVIGIYVTAPGAGEFDKTTRMFAPAYGIPEEAATGMAGGLLAAYLHDCAAIVRDRYAFEQGACMSPPSPSRIVAYLVTERDRIREVWVGGRAEVLEQRELRVLL